ncbi:MAG TPA: circularly permuted type 2 ATP-grasp protein [Chthoniobacterales bacterium]
MQILTSKRAASLAAPSQTWNEVFAAPGTPRLPYAPLVGHFQGLSRTALRKLDDNLESTLREMGVTFDLTRGKPTSQRPWYCDLLPQIFSAPEWDHVTRGMRQRLNAFELFLRDIYGGRHILKDGKIPVQAVLSSPYFQRAAVGLPLPDNAFLHLCGLSLCRTPDGELHVKHHYFSNASGVSYMMQNRRALARVIPNHFEGYSIHSIVDTPMEILSLLRNFSASSDPTVVLLSPGPGSAAFSEHSFLARRMGISLVQGNDLVVVNDLVYLKTISGLERVHVIYTRVADAWLDPLAFRPDSYLGVPGLVNSIRKGAVRVINAIGAQAADDRALLCFSQAIIAYYLGEKPILPTLQTYWLGDIDQREFVLGNLEKYTIRPLYGERILTPGQGEPLSDYRRRQVLKEVQQYASAYVAQPRDADAATLSFQSGRRSLRTQDHIAFALRHGEADWEVFPGALTRITTAQSPYTASELGGGSKDTWIESLFGETDAPGEARRIADPRLPAQHVTSRVAEAMYWSGRYLERASSLANMIGVIETLELEELNETERQLYRPIWNRMLPPLETRAETRRTLSSSRGRYRLALDPRESGSLINNVFRAAGNAESVLECLSSEAWSVLSTLRSRFKAVRFQEKLSEEKKRFATRRMCDAATHLIPQFFGTAEFTMVADGGWNFCLIGQMVERATVTANAANSMANALLSATGQNARSDHAIEIQLSAFLRLLSCRDAYHRVFQSRIELAPVLELLWEGEAVPRSVQRCLDRVSTLLQESQPPGSRAIQRTLTEIHSLNSIIRHTSWEKLVEETFGAPAQTAGTKAGLIRHITKLADHVYGIHHYIADGFLNHQIHMHEENQPPLHGL